MKMGDGMEINGNKGKMVGVQVLLMGMMGAFMVSGNGAEA